MDTSIWGPGPGVQSQTPQQLHFILPNMGAKMCLRLLDPQCTEVHFSREIVARESYSMCYFHT